MESVKNITQSKNKYYCLHCHNLINNTKSNISRHLNTDKHAKLVILKKDFIDDDFVNEIDDYIYNITFNKF
jgi:hypothetical protein